MPTALAAAVKLNAPRPSHSSPVPCPMRRTLAEEVVRSVLLAPFAAVNLGAPNVGFLVPEDTLIPCPASCAEQWQRRPLGSAYCQSSDTTQSLCPLHAYGDDGGGRPKAYYETLT